MVPEQYTGATQEAYLAGFKVTCHVYLLTKQGCKAPKPLQGGYAAGVQVTVNVTLGSDKGVKAVEYNGGVQQVHALNHLSPSVLHHVTEESLTQFTCTL